MLSDAPLTAAGGHSPAKQPCGAVPPLANDDTLNVTGEYWHTELLVALMVTAGLRLGITTMVRLSDT